MAKKNADSLADKVEVACKEPEVLKEIVNALFAGANDALHDLVFARYKGRTPDEKQDHVVRVREQADIVDRIGSLSSFLNECI
jgi:hypothetical protein